MAVLILFAQTRGFHLLFDGLTYAALSRNILRTGDWAHLHYGLEQYPDFYQHPPLAIWMQALVFKLFGFSEPISRILPSLFALGSVWVVFTVARVRSGLASGVFSALVLLSSTRFVKWGSNFYLDGILAFFGLSAAAALFLGMSERGFSDRKRRLILLLGGVSFAFAFMVKGIAALPAAGACGLIFLFQVRRDRFLEVGYFAVGVLLPLMAWFSFADGFSFLQYYFEVSASGRTNFHQLSPHPWRNLYLIWLPWFPVFLVSIFCSVRGWFKGDPFAREMLIWSLAAIMVPIAYSFGTTFLEHYMTPFYPFAALAVGMQCSRWAPELTDRGLRLMRGAFVGVSLFLATVAPDVNFQKPIAADHWIEQVRSLSPEAQGRVKQIAFTEKAGDLWVNLAVLLGRGDTQAIGAFDLKRSPIPGTILVTRSEEAPTSKDWAPVSCLFLKEFRIYSSRNETYCD
jgi:4-amino-4-deoxy-L-arabinose transferase-like glycosyltransferase